MTKCKFCDKPATVALLGKGGEFDIYLCMEHLLKGIRQKLRVKDAKRRIYGTETNSN